MPRIYTYEHRMSGQQEVIAAVLGSLLGQFHRVEEDKSRRHSRAYFVV